MSHIQKDTAENTFSGAWSQTAVILMYSVPFKSADPTFLYKKYPKFISTTTEKKMCEILRNSSRLPKRAKNALAT